MVTQNLSPGITYIGNATDSFFQQSANSPGQNFAPSTYLRLIPIIVADAIEHATKDANIKRMTCLLSR